MVTRNFIAAENKPGNPIQIRIDPASEDLGPPYKQIAFAPAEKQGRFRLLAAPEPSQGATVINQNARLYVATLQSGQTLKQVLAPGRHAWVQVVRGSIFLNGQPLSDGDGAGVSDEQELSFAGNGSEGGEVLFFDLP